MRIRIISTPEQQNNSIDGSQPQMKFGGQRFGGLETGQTYVDPSLYSFAQDPFMSVTSSINAVPKEEATIEAEGGETLVRNQPNGSIAQFNINGPSHAEGGVPLSGKPGDFIFSKTKKMEIGGPILEMFGKSADTKKKYSPAELAKQYDINKFQAILADPASDNLQKKTAANMIENFSKKLGELALVQEAKKGFPQGIPQLAQEALQQPKNGQEQPSMKYGGKFKMRIGGEASLPGDSRFDANYLAPEKQNVIPDIPSYQAPIFIDESLNSPEKYEGYTNTYDSTKHPGNAETNDNPAYPFDFRNQDKMAMQLGQLQYSNIRKYPGYIAPLQMTAPHYALSDNSAEKASIAGAAKTQSMIGAMSIDGSKGRSNDSQIWGEALSRIMGSDAQNEEKRIGVSNTGNKETAEITNKQLEFNQQRLSELYKQNIISQQQYDNAIKEGQDKLLLKPYVQAMDNRAKIDMVNRMNANSGHYIDPTTGRVIFSPAFDTAGGSNKGNFGQTLQMAQKNIMDNNPGIDPNLAWKMADNQLRMDRTRTTYNPMNPKQTRITGSSGDYGYGDAYGTGYLD